jgi:hypothetical protein
MLGLNCHFLCVSMFFIFCCFSAFIYLFFFKKKRGEKDADIYFSFNFLDILCILPDVSVPGALILLLLYT